jgi:hypothetical protein
MPSSRVSEVCKQKSGTWSRQACLTCYRKECLTGRGVEPWNSRYIKRATLQISPVARVICSLFNRFLFWSSIAPFACSHQKMFCAQTWWVGKV